MSGPQMTPPARSRRLVATPTPRPDGCVYVRVEVQLPDGRGVVASHVEEPDPDAAQSYARQEGPPTVVALRLLHEAHQEAINGLDAL